MPRLVELGPMVPNIAFIMLFFLIVGFKGTIRSFKL